jgi:hypothetical protein
MQNKDVNASAWRNTGRTTCKVITKNVLIQTELEIGGLIFLKYSNVNKAPKLLFLEKWNQLEAIYTFMISYCNKLIH